MLPTAKPAPKTRIGFFHLPGELRNAIYELSLKYHWHTRRIKDATPALLRSCRQVYKEARGILYDQSTIGLYADFEAFEEHQPSCGYLIAIEKDDTKEGVVTPTLSGLETSIPVYISEVRNLDVIINCWVRGHLRVSESLSAHHFIGVNHLLYVLASCYREGTLRLQLDLQYDFRDDVVNPRDLLYPISKFAPGVQLELDCPEVLSEEDKNKLLALRNDPAKAKVLEFSALEQWNSKSQLIPDFINRHQQDDMRFPKRVLELCYSCISGRRNCLSYSGDKVLMDRWNMVLEALESEDEEIAKRKLVELGKSKWMLM